MYFSSVRRICCCLCLSSLPLCSFGPEKWSVNGIHPLSCVANRKLLLYFENRYLTYERKSLGPHFHKIGLCAFIWNRCIVCFYLWRLRLATCTCQKWSTTKIDFSNIIFVKEKVLIRTSSLLVFPIQYRISLQKDVWMRIHWFELIFVLTETKRFLVGFRKGF